MGRILLFLKSIYLPLLFILMEVLVINYYASSTTYTRAKILTASNSVLYGLNRSVGGVKSYFWLRAENDELTSEIVKLNNRLGAVGAEQEYLQSGDSVTGGGAEFGYIEARVVKNTANRADNFILINKGSNQGVKINMAITTMDMKIVGYVADVRDNFCAAVSVLNTKFHTGGELKRDGGFGSIFWNGQNNKVVTLTEIPRHADIEVGDSIITGHSSIFPSGILIGRVKSRELIRSSYFEAEVELATDFSRLNRVMLIEYQNQEELRALDLLMQGREDEDGRVEN